MSRPPFEISDVEIRRLVGHLLKDAEEEASRLKHNYIGTEHIFNGLTRIPGGVTVRMLQSATLDPREVRNEIRREVGQGDELVAEHPPFTPRAYNVLAQAIYLADDMGDERVSEEQLLLSLLNEGEGVAARKLLELSVDIEHWINTLTEQLQLDDLLHLNRDDLDSSDELYYYDDEFGHSFAPYAEGDSESFSHLPTPLLDKYGRDLTEQARLGKINPAVGREREIRALARTLTRSKKNNPLLLGDAGVGKTAVVEGLPGKLPTARPPLPCATNASSKLKLGPWSPEPACAASLRSAWWALWKKPKAPGPLSSLSMKFTPLLAPGIPLIATWTRRTSSSQRWPGAKSPASAPLRLKNIARPSLRTRPWIGVSAPSACRSPTPPMP
ncbi:MAG: ATP-dependent Clp protease ATP-binding subunit [Anaerolineae bacterium]|nr:ATP-dependent Clp protease ATP-binding subunit [Anaerolineae bacterium]